MSGMKKLVSDSRVNQILESGYVAHDGKDAYFIPFSNADSEHVVLLGEPGVFMEGMRIGSSEFRLYLGETLGLAPRGRTTTKLVEELEGRAFSSGREVEVRILARAVERDGTTTLEIALGGGLAVEVGLGMRLTSAYDPYEGTLLLAPPRFEPLRLDLDEMHRRYAIDGADPLELRRLGRGFLGKLPPPVSGGLSRSEQQALIFAFWLSVFVAPLARARAILALFGPPGCGKTVTARLLGRLFFGPSFDVSGGMSGGRAVKDLFAALTATSLVARDDLNTAPAELMDALCRVATGARIEVSEFYETLALASFESRAALAITAYQPGWLKRRDLLTRLLVIRLGQPEPSAETDRDREARVDRLRQFAWYETLSLLDAALQHIKARPPITRFGDWEQIARSAADVAGFGPVLESALRKLDLERVAVVAASDPFLAALVALAHSEHGGNWLTSAELVTALQRLDGHDELTRATPTAVGRVLARLERDGSAAVRVERSPFKVTGNKTRWRISPL